METYVQAREILSVFEAILNGTQLRRLLLLKEINNLRRANTNHVEARRTSPTKCSFSTASYDCGSHRTNEPIAGVIEGSHANETKRETTGSGALELNESEPFGLELQRFHQDRSDWWLTQGWSKRTAC
ncbi:hypothetical protein ABIA00_002172 [Bradyrhizobium ottawaense]|uniref:hypothetical protein n=1 Tax=Bradyrhizobium ottawaense TaxID=931866 RepID=UPI003839A284